MHTAPSEVVMFIYINCGFIFNQFFRQNDNTLSIQVNTLTCIIIEKSSLSKALYILLFRNNLAAANFGKCTVQN